MTVVLYNSCVIHHLVMLASHGTLYNTVVPKIIMHRCNEIEPIRFIVLNTIKSIQNITAAL